MNKAKRLIKNILLLLSGNFVAKVLSFLMVPFYTSILSTSDYGTADLISTTVLLVLPFFSVLMDEAVMRFALDRANNDKQIFSIAMAVSTAGFLLVLCLSPIILLFDSLRPYYGFVVLYYISLWLYNIFASYVKGLDKLKITTTAGIIHTFFYLILNIIGLAVLKLGVYGYLLAIDLSNIIAALFLFFYCRLYKNLIRPNLIDKNLLKEMVKYSTPMIPDYISWWVVNCSDRYMVAYFCGTGITGIYSVAYKIPTLLNSLTSIFSSAWKISSVDEFGSEESKKFYQQVYRIYSCLLLVGGAVLIAISKPLSSFLFAKEFFAAWKITPILVLAYIFSAQALFIGSIFTASKQTKRMAVAPIIGAIVNITFNALLIPKFQGSGAAIGTVIGYVVILIINLINTNKILNIHLVRFSDLLSYVFIVIEIIALVGQLEFSWVIIIVSCVLVMCANMKYMRDVFMMVRERIIKK